MTRTSNLAYMACVLMVAFGTLGACGSSGGTPANRAPAIDSIAADPDPAANGSTVTITVSATDADGDELTYTWTVPSDYVIQSGQGTDEIVARVRLFVSGNVSVTVDDGNGGSATDAVAVDVAPGSWNTETLVETDDTEDASSPQVAVDANGNATAVWHQDDGARQNVWSNRYDATSGTWSTAVLIETDDTEDAHRPKVAVDANGNATAVWLQRAPGMNNAWTNRYDATTGMWGTAVLLETNPIDALNPQVAVDANGDVVVVWEQYDGTEVSIWSNRYDETSGLWGTAARIETNDDGPAFLPQLAFDANGNATAVWEQSDGVLRNIWSNRYDAMSGMWGTAVLIEMVDTFHTFSPQVAVDANGNAKAVW